MDGGAVSGGGALYGYGTSYGASSKGGHYWTWGGANSGVPTTASTEAEAVKLVWREAEAAVAAETGEESPTLFVVAERVVTQRTGVQVACDTLVNEIDALGRVLVPARRLFILSPLPSARALSLRPLLVLAPGSSSPTSTPHLSACASRRAIARPSGPTSRQLDGPTMSTAARVRHVRQPRPREAAQ